MCVLYCNIHSRLQDYFNNGLATLFLVICKIIKLFYVTKFWQANGYRYVTGSKTASRTDNPPNKIKRVVWITLGLQDIFNNGLAVFLQVICTIIKLFAVSRFVAGIISSVIWTEENGWAMWPKVVPRAFPLEIMETRFNMALVRACSGFFRVDRLWLTCLLSLVLRPSPNHSQQCSARRLYWIVSYNSPVLNSSRSLI